MAGELPDDLISNIFAWLPVKSLFRFRSVSKHLRSLIDNTKFHKQHLTLSTLNKSKHTTLIFRNQYSYNIHHSDFQSLGGLIFSPAQHATTQSVQPITNPNRSYIDLIGSCNGLLCLLYRDIYCLIIIWNPTTRKHVKLSPVGPFLSYLKSLDKYYSTKTTVHGFGYDSVSEHYKLVFMDASVTYVYSLRLDSWRLVKHVNPDYLLYEPIRRDVVACGAMHWMCAKPQPGLEYPIDLVGAFDFTKEEHVTLELPEGIDNDKLPIVFVSELGGCLSVVCNYLDHDVFDVWVMKVYGTRESWTKVFTFSCTDNVGYVRRVVPLSYSGCGRKVLLMLNAKKLLWYDLENETLQFVNVGWVHEPLYPVICLESLVSLDEGAEADETPDGEIERAKDEASGRCSVEVN